jgi:hypothetical protein
VKRLSLAVVAAFAAAGIGATSVSASELHTAQGNAANLPTVRIAQADMNGGNGAPADFGNPPSGEVPLLFNDHHVYSTPDTLRQGRVLAALVRGGEILVPLRSMFEAMGATVAYDPATKTADVSKPGSDVKVTIGQPSVVINGETRPLDVPPMMYKGSVVVPIRVISEGMGAYVQWVPDRRVVVVRYVAAPVPTPPPTAPPTAPPTMAPTPVPPPPTPAPTPTPVPVHTVYDRFIVGDYIFSPQVYNQFSPGNHTMGPSYAGRAGFEFPIDKLPFMVEFDYRQFAYPHVGNYDGVVPRNGSCAGIAGDPGCVTNVGGAGSGYVPSFGAQDKELSGRFGFQILKPRIYLAGAYLERTNNYGSPFLRGAGAGIEKLADYDKPISFFGSFYYFPSIQGSIYDPSVGATYQEQYRFEQYEAGVDVNLPFDVFKQTGIFLEGGYIGDTGINKQFAPGNIREGGAFAGIGIHF